MSAQFGHIKQTGGDLLIDPAAEVPQATTVRERAIYLKRDSEEKD